MEQDICVRLMKKKHCDGLRLPPPSSVYRAALVARALMQHSHADTEREYKSTKVFPKIIKSIPLTCNSLYSRKNT